jgi:plastocyanin
MHTVNSKLSCGLLAAIVLALAGCGEDNDEGSSTGSTGTGTEEQAAPPEAAPSETVELTETEFKIAPADVKVDKAGVVAFRVQNDGGVVHALEVEGGDLEEETDDIEPGGSATLKVDLAEGSYEMYCPIGNHKDQGMEGTLTVGAASSSSDDSGGGSDDDDSGY